MNLLIDSGNTFTKIAFCDPKSITEVRRIENIEELKALALKHHPENVIVSSVNKDIEELEKCFPMSNVIRFSYQTPIPIRNLYKTPATLGMDRLAGVIGAASLYEGENCLCIDAGTCITYDVMDANGCYVGGSIAPGIEMRFKALHTFTAKLPLVERVKEVKRTGGTTEESIQSGVLYGVIKEMEGIVADYKKEYKALKIIITGGDAIFFETNVKDSIFVEPNLLFVGLKRILEYNVSKF